VVLYFWEREVEEAVNLAGGGWWVVVERDEKMEKEENGI